jgi:di- and tripeptidase
VLALEYASDKHWLFSSSGVFRHCSMISANHRITQGIAPSASVPLPLPRPASRSRIKQVWCTKKLTPLYLINPFPDSGDLFSLAWSPLLSTIYIGCQNTSLQWYNFRDSVPTQSQQSSGTSTPRPAHKFFNSYPRFQRRSPDLESSNGINKLVQGEDGHIVFIHPPTPRAEFNIPAQNVIDSAHFGYVYCMVLMPSTCQGATSAPQEAVLLATGSGDETVKVCMARMRL